MQHFNTKKLTVAAVAAGLSVMAIGAPASIAAKKHKVTFVNKGNTTNLNGTITGSFGKGKQSGTLLIPKLKYVWKFKGGTIYATGLSGDAQGNVFPGTWKVKKGTGKFKGIKGGGKFKGTLSSTTSVFKFTGTVTY